MNKVLKLQKPDQIKSDQEYFNQSQRHCITIHIIKLRAEHELLAHLTVIRSKVITLTSNYGQVSVGVI